MSLFQENVETLYITRDNKTDPQLDYVILSN